MPQTGPSHTFIPTSGPRWSASCMISAWTGPAVSTRPIRASRTAPGEAASAAAERIRAMRLRHPSPGRPRSSVTASVAHSRERCAESLQATLPSLQPPDGKHLGVALRARSYGLLGPSPGGPWSTRAAAAAMRSRNSPAAEPARPAAPPPHGRTHGPLPRPGTGVGLNDTSRAAAEPASDPDRSSGRQANRESGHRRSQSGHKV